MVTLNEGIVQYEHEASEVIRQFRAAEYDTTDVAYVPDFRVFHAEFPEDVTGVLDGSCNRDRHDHTWDHSQDGERPDYNSSSRAHDEIANRLTKGTRV